MEAVIFHSPSDKSITDSSHKSPTVRTHKNQKAPSNFEAAGILPSPPLIISNHSQLSSYPPFSSHKKQPPLLPHPGQSLLRNSSIKTVQINPLVRGLSLPPITTKPIKKSNIPSSKYSSSLIAPRKSSTSSSLALKQPAAASVGFSKDIAVSAGGGSRAMCRVLQGTRYMKNLSKSEQVSPKLLIKEIDKVGDFWESVVFTLSPPPSSLPMPSFSILRPIYSAADTDNPQQKIRPLRPILSRAQFFA